MADFCNQCKEELGLVHPDHPSTLVSDYPDYGLLDEGYGWQVICEGCGFTTIDRKGNCTGNHSIDKIIHKLVELVRQ